MESEIRKHKDIFDATRLNLRGTTGEEEKAARGKK
jgi:hypothetical protein